jgi:hypothetical protein
VSSIIHVFKQKNRLEGVLRWIFAAGFLLAVVSMTFVSVRYGLDRQDRFEIAVIMKRWYGFRIPAHPPTQSQRKAILLDPLSSTFPTQIIALTCGITALFLVVAFYGMYRTAKKRRNQVAKALPATARIIKIGHSSSSANYGTVLVHLTFEVMPTNGASYELVTEWFVEPASVSKLEEGKILNIKIDPKNPKTIYSAEAWAKAMGQESVE